MSQLALLRGGQLAVGGGSGNGLTADQLVQFNFAIGKWWEVQARWMKATFPNITAVSPPIKFGQYSLGAGTGVNGASTLGVEGGGGTAPAGGPYQAFASGIFAQVKTVADGCYVCRGYLLSRAGGIARIALNNISGRETFIGTDETNFPGKYVIGAGATLAAGQGQATATNVSAGLLDFAIGFKDANVYFFANQVQIGTIARANLVVDEALLPVLRNGTLGDAGGVLGVYGYAFP